MFTRERDYFPWIVFVITLVGLAGLQYWKRRPDNAPPAPLTEQARPETAAARPSLQPAQQIPAAVPRRQVAATSVYDCSEGKQPSYSDRPCVNGGVRRDVEITLNTYTSPPMPRSVDPVTSMRSGSRRYDRGVESADGAGSLACDSLFAAKERIDARMRSSYTGGEGEWLRARRHRIVDEIYELHCLRGR
jgi:hypothetical protein